MSDCTQTYLRMERGGRGRSGAAEDWAGGWALLGEDGEHWVTLGLAPCSKQPESFETAVGRMEAETGFLKGSARAQERTGDIARLMSSIRERWTAGLGVKEWQRDSINGDAQRCPCGLRASPRPPCAVSPVPASLLTGILHQIRPCWRNLHSPFLV